jgi:hypothetical protein
MKKILRTKGGYSGMLLLVITFGLIMFLIMLQWGVFAKKDETTGQTKMQRDQQAVDDAKALKNVMEKQNQQAVME